MSRIPEDFMPEILTWLSDFEPCETLNPELLNPKLLDPTPQTPKPLNPKP